MQAFLFSGELFLKCEAQLSAGGFLEGVEDSSYRSPPATP